MFRILQECDNFRNGTAELSFRILPENDNLWNGTAERIISGTERNCAPDFTRI